MSSWISFCITTLLIFPTITISNQCNNHIFILFNNTSTTNTNPYQFISKLLSPSLPNQYIHTQHITIDCIQIIHQTDTKFITETHSNCHKSKPTSTNTHNTTDIIHHSYPFNTHHIYQTLQNSLYPHSPNILLIISFDLNTIQLLQLHLANKITVQKTFTTHDIASLQKHIFCINPQQRHLLQIPTPSPSTIIPSITPPPVTTLPTPIDTISPTIQPTINTIPPTINPTLTPTNNPTSIPTHTPTNNPILLPTNTPSISPGSLTINPTVTPTNNPSIAPSVSISNHTQIPTNNPTIVLTNTPTNNPTVMPLLLPSLTPSVSPSISNNNPTQNPIFSTTNILSDTPTLSPYNMPTKSPSISPLYCPGICDMYNVTLTSINQTIFECKKEANCECNTGIKQLKMKYLGDSIASEIIFYYKNEIQICKHSNIKYNDIITCDVKETHYRQFSSSTQFVIKYTDNLSCNGYIDTSCTYDIFGTLSRKCQYLQIIQYTDYFDGICYDTNVPKLIVKSDEKRNNYWKTKTRNSDSSDSHSKRRGLQWENKYKYNIYSSSSSSSSSSEWKQNKKCLHNSDSSDSDSIDEYYSIQSQVCLNYSIKNLINTKKCGDLDTILLPICRNNITDMTGNDLDKLIVSISPKKLSATGVDEDILGILISFSDDDINEFELCLKSVSVSTDINTIAIADYAKLNVNGNTAICNNSDGLACLSFVFDDVGDAFAMERMDLGSNGKNCECNNGLISLDVKYEGDEIADLIQFRSNRGPSSLLCTFMDVLPSEVLTCNYNNDDTFGYKTFVDITENGNECTGTLWTSCVNNVLGRLDDGCNKLRIIGWRDGLNAICDESVNNYYLTSVDDIFYNALMSENERDSNNDAIQVFDRMDISLQAILIFIAIGFFCGLIWVIAIICFGICYQFMDYQSINDIQHNTRSIMKLKGIINTIAHDNNDTVTSKSIDNEQKYEEEIPGGGDIFQFNQIKTECDQESMKRHKFDRDSMKSSNTTSDQKLNRNQHVVDMLNNNHTIYQQNNANTDDIDPHILYTMAKLFSQSDSEHI